MGLFLPLALRTPAFLRWAIFRDPFHAISKDSANLIQHD
jgi:hypothetical protein